MNSTTNEQMLSLLVQGSQTNRPFTCVLWILSNISLISIIIIIIVIIIIIITIIITIIAIIIKYSNVGVFNGKQWQKRSVSSEYKITDLI